MKRAKQISMFMISAQLSGLGKEGFLSFFDIQDISEMEEALNNDYEVKYQKSRLQTGSIAFTYP